MRHIVIIGNSAAGISAGEIIRSKDKSSKITIVSDENYPAYHRCLISHYLSGDIKEERIVYRTEDFYSSCNIELLLNRRAKAIDVKKNQIAIEDLSNPSSKIKLDYDCLLLANGASSKFPKEIKGIQKDGVFGFRTIADAKQISELIPAAQSACVLGGGLVGLKAAYGLKKRNLEVKVIVRSSQILSQVLDKEAASLFQRRFAENGIDILFGSDVAEIIGNGDVKAVKLSSEKVIGCSIVVVAKGVEPNVGLIKDTGINFQEGVLVDDYLKTNIPNIYAAGDIAQVFDPILGEKQVNALWPNAVEQGMLSGENILGENKKYIGSVGMNSVEFFGLPMISFGITNSKAGEYEELIYKNEKQDIYKKLLLKDNVIKGAIFVKKVENIGILLKLARLRIDVSSIKDKLLDPSFNFAHTKDMDYEKDNVYL